MKRTRYKKKRKKEEFTYLEKVLNTKVLKVLQSHVIAYHHVLVCHDLLEPFPG